MIAFTTNGMKTNLILIHQAFLTRPFCLLSTFSWTDEHLTTRRTMSTANTEAPYQEVNGSVGSRLPLPSFQKVPKEISNLWVGLSFFLSLSPSLSFFLPPSDIFKQTWTQITAGFHFFFCFLFCVSFTPREHALQSGQHASYTESEHDATHSAVTDLNQSTSIRLCVCVDTVQNK